MSGFNILIKATGGFVAGLGCDDELSRVTPMLDQPPCLARGWLRWLNSRPRGKSWSLGRLFPGVTWFLLETTSAGRNSLSKGEDCVSFVPSDEGFN